MRDQQHLGVLRVREGVITLEQLYFVDEIRPIDEIKPDSSGRINKEQLEMALRLIESYKDHWQPGKYKDTYRDELMKVIEAKRKGKDVHAAAETEESDQPPDLMTALRESLEHSKGTRRRTSRRKSENRPRARTQSSSNRRRAKR